jgi:Uncharacterised nucleotidyltransferase
MNGAARRCSVRHPDFTPCSWLAASICDNRITPNFTATSVGSSDRDDFRREHLLLRAAVGPADGASTRVLIDRALATDLDWTRVVELALTHRMLPALLAALEAGDPSLVPAELLTALRQSCDLLRRHSARQLTELLDLLDAFSGRSVTAVPFKGPALGQVLFNDPYLRPSSDLDILVLPTDVQRVCEVLEARGYVDADRRPGGRPMTSAQHGMYRSVQCEYRYIRHADGFVVEPHWAFSQRALAVDVDYAGVIARARPIRLGNRTVPSLAPEDLLLALCIHGSKHQWERLNWIRDVAALVFGNHELDLEMSVERAKSFGCARMMLVGMLVAARCTELHIPPSIQRFVDADPRTVTLADEVIAALFTSGRRVPNHDRIDRFRFQIRERPSDRARYVARTLLFPGRGHIEMIALPAALSGAYFPLKWMHALLLLPLWRITKLGVASYRALRSDQPSPQSSRN